MTGKTATPPGEPLISYNPARESRIEPKRNGEIRDERLFSVDFVSL
jgi:hypothetical protein